jgi:hypothetical protein
VALIRLPGSARRYLNPETGETLSRRQAELAPRARALGYPSSSAWQAARRFEREHPPEPGWSPRPMRTFARGTLPGAWQELRLTPVSWRDASLIGRWYRAVWRYADPRTAASGNRELRRFERTSIYTREMGVVQLLVDRRALRELVQAGELAFEDLYEALPHAA